MRLFLFAAVSAVSVLTAAGSNPAASVIEANDRMDAITLEMEAIEFAINALPVSSAEGLRAKALVTLHDIRPVTAGDREYDFQDPTAFQRLFEAVSQLVGISEKVSATGYVMPPYPVLRELDDLDEEEPDEVEA